MEQRWLSVQAAAQYLSVTVFTVRDAAWRGELAYIKAGKRWVFDRLDLDKFMESRKRKEPAFS